MRLFVCLFVLFTAFGLGVRQERGPDTRASLFCSLTCYIFEFLCIVQRPSVQNKTKQRARALIYKATGLEAPLNNAARALPRQQVA